jgi:hypothetical protein
MNLAGLLPGLFHEIEAKDLPAAGKFAEFEIPKCLNIVSKEERNL